MYSIKELITQIKNKSIPNLLEEERYDKYKSLYDLYVNNENIENLINEKIPEQKNKIERILYSCLCNKNVCIKDVSIYLYISEYFTEFKIRFINDSLVYNILIEYYLLYKKEKTIEHVCMHTAREHTQNVDTDDTLDSTAYKCENAKDINSEQYCTQQGNNTNCINDSTQYLQHISSENSRYANENTRYWNEHTEYLNDNIRCYILKYRMDKKLLSTKKNKVDTFLIYYNTKTRILKEDISTYLINAICSYLYTDNLIKIYDILEDKTEINKEINKRNLFTQMIHKIIRDTLITINTLINLKIDKKVFYLHLTRWTMTIPKLLDTNCKKFIHILKIVKYKEKHILLIEWLKAFVFHKQYKCFMKLYNKIRKQKIHNTDISAFKILYNILRKGSVTRVFDIRPFIVRIKPLKDTEYSVCLYKDIYAQFV